MLRRSSSLKNVLPMAAVAAMLAWAGPANASLVVDPAGNAILGIEKKIAVLDPGDTLFITNIYVRFSEANDILTGIGAAQMFTKNGSKFHQFAPPFGTDTAPADGFILVFPALANDSYVTIGLKTVPDGFTDLTSLDPDWQALGFNSAQFGPGSAVGGWSANPAIGQQGHADFTPLNPDGTYWVLIAQLTVTAKPDAGVLGDMLVFWQEDDGGASLNNPGSFDNQIPSPGALALLGLAGLVGARRRRRR